MTFLALISRIKEKEKKKKCKKEYKESRATLDLTPVRII